MNEQQSVKDPVFTLTRQKIPSDKGEIFVDYAYCLFCLTLPSYQRQHGSLLKEKKYHFALLQAAKDLYKAFGSCSNVSHHL